MGWSAFFLLAILVLLTLMVWSWTRSRSLETQSGLPAGQIIYSDTGAWFANTETLLAPDIGLVGRPDYLVRQQDGSIVPVELKSGRAPQAPWEGHVLQLAAYCLLVDEAYGIRPSFGILQYKDRAFAIDYTEELEDDLLDLLAEMREDLFAGELDRDHNDWQRCARCGVRRHCYQRLA